MKIRNVAANSLLLLMIFSFGALASAASGPNPAPSQWSGWEETSPDSEWKPDRSVYEGEGYPVMQEFTWTNEDTGEEVIFQGPIEEADFNTAYFKTHNGRLLTLDSEHALQIIQERSIPPELRKLLRSFKKNRK